MTWWLICGGLFVFVVLFFALAMCHAAAVGDKQLGLDEGGQKK